MYAPLFSESLKEKGLGGILLPLNNCLPTITINKDLSCFKYAMRNLQTILDDQEGVFQEDIKQWHYVTPIQTMEKGIGFRDILGVDIILNT